MNTAPLHDSQPFFTANRMMCSAANEQREASGLHEMFDLIGVPLAHGEQLPARPLTARRLAAGETLIFEGALAASIHVVRSGSFKAFRTAEDGYEQVVGFMHRGDLIGCDALAGDRHLVAAVALEDSNVFGIALPDFFALAQSHAAFDRGVMRAVSNAMIDLTRLADMMAAVAAEVRLARFLIHLSQRLAASGQAGKGLRLQMTRRDIGSYLGVAHETISRSFTVLSDLGLIEVDQRKVEIRDLAALHRFAQGTRVPAKAHLGILDAPRPARAVALA
ncbi:helix-turn-helix domain-containing protein [Variovorax sp. J22R133]|uniref:Crp/Fnr family transcriptional regulator n=1 Tax=Variovorax brevis TaxID=3053503 RepID=UPI00257524F5|nr:helix-turn-helix domain-containing protein [Variovorax sp. J22R133]MDM0110803.1 helix-turn-helix domain-containing protein [Variovorax sp. J22R133]